MKIFVQLFLIVSFLIYLPSCSRKSSSPSSSSQQSNESNPTSRERGGKKDIFDTPDASAKGKTKRKRSNLPFHEQKVKEYEDRMKANAKRDEKMAKQMEKPQYSDPTYFGHKKKPKKRPVGKRKLCKECGIVH